MSFHVVFNGLIFQQTVVIAMDTNFAPILTDFFLCSYEAEFIHIIFKDKKKKLHAKFFNFNFSYSDDALSLNNPNFNECLQLIYSSELDIKDTRLPKVQLCFILIFFSIMSILTQMNEITLHFEFPRFS